MKLIDHLMCAEGVELECWDRPKQIIVRYKTDAISTSILLDIVDDEHGLTDDSEIILSNGSVAYREGRLFIRGGTVEDNGHYSELSFRCSEETRALVFNFFLKNIKRKMITEKQQQYSLMR